MAYTATGLVTSALVGAALAWLGSALLSASRQRAALAVVAGLAVAAVVRDLGLLRFPVPQVRRQTKPYWRHSFPSLVTAMLWGADLGFVFTTYLTFLGVWVLAATALASAQIASGALLMASYWLGRALAVWLAPLVLDGPAATARLLDEVVQQEALLQLVHVGGLIWMAIVATTWLF